MSNLKDVSDAALIKEWLRRLGEDTDRGGLKETPERVVEAWKFWTSGYTQSPKDILKSFEDGSEDYDEMVFKSQIPVFSFCEHHLASMLGVAHVAYIPNGRVVGLSKLSRLVDIYAHRLQVQERLTKQIADALMKYLKPKGVGVVLQLRHLCIESRGVQKVGTITMTSALRGCIKDEPDCRSEFLTLVNTASQGLVKL